MGMCIGRSIWRGGGGWRRWFEKGQTGDMKAPAGGWSPRKGNSEVFATDCHDKSFKMRHSLVQRLSLDRSARITSPVLCARADTSFKTP